MRHMLILATALGHAALYAEAQSGDHAELALSLVNAEREERGLPELELSSTLSSAAQGHARDMMERGYYGHVTPDGETARDRFVGAGGSRWSVVAENIGRCRGCETADAARIRSFHRGWMQSPGHRENILAAGLDEFGFGLAAGEDAIHAVQTFAGPGTPPHAGPGAQPPRAGEDELRAGALDAVNAARRDAGRPPLEPSEELNALAEELVSGATFPDGELSLPSDLFALLPEGSSGWTELAVSAAACGGCGPHPAEGDGAHFGSRLAPDAGGLSQLGFALSANGEGRKVAVAVYGDR